jgi:hypothetical protein
MKMSIYRIFNNLSSIKIKGGFRNYTRWKFKVYWASPQKLVIRLFKKTFVILINRDHPSLWDRIKNAIRGMK